MELYSHSRYKGFLLFVESYEIDNGEFIYEGVAQFNGTTVYETKSYITGDKAEDSLRALIDKDLSCK